MIDREGNVHIVDFGLARFWEDVTVTSTGQLIGTPMYMSPEQVTGRLEVDHRTDNYSLGLVLYELLCLRRPIRAATRESVLRSIVTKAMPPLSWQNNSVPPELEGVVHKAISKDSDHRYQSATEFANDLQKWLDHRDVEARPYVYNFDFAEIAATRPTTVTVVEVVCFSYGIVVLITSLGHIAGMLAGFIPPDSADNRLMVLNILASIICAGVGVGFHFAEPWTIRWGPIGALLSLGFHVHLLVKAIVNHWSTPVLWYGLWWEVVDAGPLIAVVAVALVCGLAPSTRKWLRDAARIRAEQKSGRPG